MLLKNNAYFFHLIFFNRFFERFPEYEARLAQMQDPEERLRYFLVDEIWTGYMGMGSANKELARLQMGEQFQQAFLDKETRSYADIDMNTLAMWTQQLKGYVPKDSENRIEVPEQAQPLAMLPPELAGPVDTFRETRNTEHPNWFAVQSAYYDQTDQAGRRRVKAQFPELEEYWDWRRQYLTDHPDVAAYSRQYDLENEAAGGSLGTLSVPEILTNPILMRQLQADRQAGQPLTSGAWAELGRIWRSMGKPGESLEEWVERLNLEGSTTGAGGVQYQP